MTTKGNEKTTDEYVQVSITGQQFIGQGASGSVYFLHLSNAKGAEGTQVAKVFMRDRSQSDEILLASIGHELRVSRAAASRLGENAPVVDESGIYMYRAGQEAGKLSIVRILSNIDDVRETFRTSSEISDQESDIRWGIQSTFAGKPLKSFEPASVGEAVSMYSKIADAFTKAAQRGLGTTDVSEGNVLVNEQGGVELVDFGGYSALMDMNGEDLYQLAVYNRPFSNARTNLLFLLYLTFDEKYKRNITLLQEQIKILNDSEVSTMIIQIQGALISAGKYVFDDARKLGGLSAAEFLILFLERSDAVIDWNCSTLRQKATVPPMLDSGEYAICSPQTVNPALIGTLVDAKSLWQLNLVHTFEVAMLLLRKLGIVIYPYGYSLENGQISYAINDGTKKEMITSIWRTIFDKGGDRGAAEIIPFEEFQTLCSDTMINQSTVKELYAILSPFWREYWEVMVARSKSSFDTEINPTILMQQISSAMAEPSEV